jgi:hypothetical protein
MRALREALVSALSSAVLTLLEGTGSAVICLGVPVLPCWERVVQPGIHADVLLGAVAFCHV